MNPELRRNLWIELSPHRLIAMPAVLGLLFIVAGLLSRGHAPQTLAWIGVACFSIITALWGMRLAANSIFDELIDKTWDWQRLSTLRPWAMTWAKLFGSTVYAWYGGLIGLAVFVAFAPVAGQEFRWHAAAALILAAVALHAVTLAGALLNTRRTGGIAPGRRSTGLLIILAWVFGGRFVSPRIDADVATIVWYGHGYAAHDFMLVSIAVFAAWALFGAYRSMCQSLAVATTPWAIVCFIVFLSLYSAGFLLGRVIPSNMELQAIAFCGLGWSAAATYLFLFTEPTGPVIIRRVLRKLRQRHWKRLLEELPCWPACWILLALCALALTIFPLGTFPSFAGRWAFAPLAFAFLTLRDGAILVFFAASERPRRAVAATLIYILVLDWLLPALLAAMGLPQLARIVLPLSRAGEGLSLPTLIAVAQSVLACWLAVRRVRLRVA